jgi:hypothetical protein
MAYDKPTEDPIMYTHRDFGAANFDRSLPNAYERMFMICRAINFDLGNYNKLYSTPDYPSKRRYIKAVFRFLDNPISFLGSELRPYFLSGKIRMLPFYWFLTMGFTWWFVGRYMGRTAELIAIDQVYSGHKAIETPVENFSGSKLLSMLFHHTEGNAAKGMISSKNVLPSPLFCRLNYHIRDQNIRKYIAHRERRGADVFTGKPLNR